MNTRRESTGIAFLGCGLPSASPGYADAPAAASAPTRRREVVVNGRRVKTVDVHAHCGIPEAMALMGLKVTPSLLMSQPQDRLRAMDEHPADRDVARDIALLGIKASP